MYSRCITSIDMSTASTCNRQGALRRRGHEGSHAETSCRPTEASRAIRKKLKYGNVHRQLRALTVRFLLSVSDELTPRRSSKHSSRTAALAFRVRVYSMEQHEG